jgi:type II secretory pathway component PulF
MTDEQLDKPFTLSEIHQAALSLASLTESLTLDQALEEMAKMQRNRATFWLTASSTVLEGKKLSTFLSTYWKPMYAIPVAIAEETGRLPTVMEGLAATIELQLEIRATMLKLIYPLSMIFVGIGVNLFMLLAVIPELQFNDGNKPSAAIQFSRSVHDFIAGQPLLLLAIAAGIITWIYRLMQQPDVIARLLSKLDDLPALASKVRSLYFGLWSRYIGLMLECGVPLQDALQLSEPLLLPYMVPSIAAVRENARTGYRHAVDLENLPADDPRQKLPVMVCNAFRLVESTGHGAKHFENAAKPLIKLGIGQIKQFLSIAEKASAVVAALIAVSPMGLYFLQMTDLITHAIH